MLDGQRARLLLGLTSFPLPSVHGSLRWNMRPDSFPSRTGLRKSRKGNALSSTAAVCLQEPPRAPTQEYASSSRVVKTTSSSISGGHPAPSRSEAQAPKEACRKNRAGFESPAAGTRTAQMRGSEKHRKQRVVYTSPGLRRNLFLGRRSVVQFFQRELISCCHLPKWKVAASSCKDQVRKRSQKTRK